MFFADDAHGNRTYIDDADCEQTYVCPACKKGVIRKCGRLMAHHFAHKVKDSCDPWYSGKMSVWHKDMQNFFPRHCQEVVVRDDERDEYHIADVVYTRGTKSYVIEFQHSAISYEDFVARTKFYMNQGYELIWVFDFCDIMPQKTIYYAEIEDSDWIRVIWPGKDRVRFLDGIDFSECADQLHIYFHINTGRGRKRLIESENYSDWERWEYIDPFCRERLFVKLYLPLFRSSKKFYALPYPETTFYKKLFDTGRSQQAFLNSTPHEVDSCKST